MDIYVHADSCPVKEEVYRVARRYSLGVTVVAVSWLRVPTDPRINLEVVKETGELDAADGWIVQHVRPGDVVVSDDILLAARYEIVHRVRRQHKRSPDRGSAL